LTSEQLNPMPDNSIVYFDLQVKKSSSDISLLFPGWVNKDERVIVLSPHDDDAILGAGYAMLASKANGAEVYVFIMCDGSAGYSQPLQKETIVSIRRTETRCAYQSLSVDPDHILHFDYPDFSLGFYLGWKLPDGSPGTMQKLLPVLREYRPTRLLVPNDFYEHTDHVATAQIGYYDGPQIGDPVLTDLGLAPPLRSMLQYAVWGDLSPQDALVNGRSTSLRANRAVLVEKNFELCVRKGIDAFQSQANIIQDMITTRKNREVGNQWLEVYLSLEPRTALNYLPYHDLVKMIENHDL
jgi:hypothetical protein